MGDIEHLKDKQRKVRASIEYHSKELKDLKVQESNIGREITNILSKSKSVSVSDHALVRYMERVLGYDIDSFREKVLTEDVKSQIKTLGGACRLEFDEYYLVVKDNVIVTVAPK